MIIEIGEIKIDLPTGDSKVGRAVINGKFKHINNIQNGKIPPLFPA